MVLTERPKGSADLATVFFSEGYLLDNTERVQELSVAIYRLLADGVPVTSAQLSNRLGWTETEVEDELASFPESVIDNDHRGRIVAFTGLSLAPTSHLFEVDGQKLYTWCVLDALFLPEILGKSARLTTRCPVSGEQVRIELSRDRVIAASPASAVMSIVAPDGKACRNNLRGAFCNHVSFFSGPEAFATWAANRSGVGSVSIADAHEMGRRRNAVRYPDVRLNGAVKTEPR